MSDSSPCACMSRYIQKPRESEYLISEVGSSVQPPGKVIHHKVFIVTSSSVASGKKKGLEKTISGIQTSIFWQPRLGRHSDHCRRLNNEDRIFIVLLQRRVANRSSVFVRGYALCMFEGRRVPGSSCLWAVYEGRVQNVNLSISI